MKKYLFAAFAAVGILSCQKGDDNLQQPETSTSAPTAYYPMSAGSYWIYDIYEIDTNGVERATGGQDSVYVAGDTLINGHSYTIMEAAGPAICFNRILRDSSGYLVTPRNYRSFAPNDFTDSLMVHAALLNSGDTLYTEVCKMHQLNDQVSVPAGTFDALMLERDITVQVAVPRPRRRLQEYRAKDVGTIIMQYGMTNNPTTYECRLVRYHIE